jgi:hypothetical protein
VVENIEVSTRSSIFKFSLIRVFFAQHQVKVEVFWPYQRISAQVSQEAYALQRKSGWVKPPIHFPRIGLLLFPCTRFGR